MTLLRRTRFYAGRLGPSGLGAHARVRARVLRLDLPFGTLHTFWLDFPSRYLRATSESRPITRIGAAGKYYIMWASSVRRWSQLHRRAARSICVAVRTIGLGVIPALQYFGVRSATVIASSNVRTLQNATDGAQDFLARTVWTRTKVTFTRLG